MLDGITHKDGRAVRSSPSSFRKASELKERWRVLAQEYLPFSEKGSAWRYSRGFANTDPRQGWKIHVSATVISACEVFEFVAPYLRMVGVAFKAPATLGDLVRINTGLLKGYSQVGKFITIYPRSDEQFRKIVLDLYERIPRSVTAPSIPFELRYKNSNIYFRYGAFVENKERPGTIESPAGELVPDRRDIPHPEWTVPPLEPDDQGRVSKSPLSTRFRVFAALSQRGKGGVYEAIDTKDGVVQKVIIKEGRHGGETDWSGLDGRGKVVREAEVLKSLFNAGVRVPEPIWSFEVDGNQYLALEKLAGKNLHEFLSTRKRRLRMSDTFYICEQVAEILERIHKAGWAWRDCKPANLMLSDRYEVRPIDFEGACRTDEEVDYFWFSPNFSAPEVLGSVAGGRSEANVAADLFSLGVTLYFVIEGKLPRKILARQDTNHECLITHKCKCSTITFKRRNVPNIVKAVIRELLSDDPASRPSAGFVAARFKSDQLHLS